MELRQLYSIQSLCGLQDRNKPNKRSTQGGKRGVETGAVEGAGERVHVAVGFGKGGMGRYWPPSDQSRPSAAVCAHSRTWIPSPIRGKLCVLTLDKSMTYGELTKYGEGESRFTGCLPNDD